MMQTNGTKHGVLPPALNRDYRSKNESYYEWHRPEVLPFVSPSHKKILEVGCGGGSFGEMLKKRASCEVWGVEPHQESAEVAANRIDKVIHGVFDENTPLPRSYFDCVIFNDVLEHLVSPGDALALTRSVLRPSGVVVASIPNIRFFPALWRIVVRAEWEYIDCGTFDKTHLRFFTRSSIQNMFMSQGYVVRQIEGINPYHDFPSLSWKAWSVYKALNGLTLGRMADMKFLQFAVVAEASNQQQS